VALNTISNLLFLYSEYITPNEVQFRQVSL